MKKIIVVIAMTFLAACGNPAQNQQPVLPQFLPTATAYIDPSYPTAQAQIAASDQTASGIDIHMQRAWMEGKNVNAEICFTLPDASDWSVWSASLTYAGTVLQEYGTTLISLQGAENGQPGSRCDMLTFVVPPDADLSNSVITINSIAAPPKQDDYCAVYMPKIQQALFERGIGIVLDCADVNGLLTMQIVSIPPEMTKEQAEQIVYSDEFYTIPGPWSFPFNLSQ